MTVMFRVSVEPPAASAVLENGVVIVACPSEAPPEISVTVTASSVAVALPLFWTLACTAYWYPVFVFEPETVSAVTLTLARAADVEGAVGVPLPPHAATVNSSEEAITERRKSSPFTAGLPLIERNRGHLENSSEAINSVFPPEGAT